MHIWNDIWGTRYACHGLEIKWMFFYDFYHIAHYYIDRHLGGAFRAKIVFF
jgi:hypothetical protein